MSRLHLNRKISRDESDESEASSVCSERSFDSFRRNDVSDVFFLHFYLNDNYVEYSFFFNFHSLAHGMDQEINLIEHLLKISKQLYIFVHQHIGLNEKMVLRA